MAKINHTELTLYAINTGELYQDHLALARATDQLITNWFTHTATKVLPRYRHEIDNTATATREELQEAAEYLREYYGRHIREF